MSLVAKLKAEAFAKKTPEAAIVETKVAEVVVEETLLADEELNPEDVQKRTVDSYEDEIKKLREENAKRRKKEAEAKELALASAEEIFKSERELYENKLAQLTEELDKSKQAKVEVADKKIEDEIKTQETSIELKAIKKQLDELRKKNEESEKILKEQKEREDDERQLRRQAAQNRFLSLLKEIPEDQHKFAQAVFKGHEDPQEGLLAVAEAKTSGIFGKKKIEVVHATPKTYTPKNVDEERTPINKKVKMTEAIKARRSSLTPGSRLT